MQETGKYKCAHVTYKLRWRGCLFSLKCTRGPKTFSAGFPKGKKLHLQCFVLQADYVIHVAQPTASNS